MSTFPETRTVEEFRDMVGQEYGVSSWMDVSQDMIDQFADVIGGLIARGLNVE